MNLGHSDVKGGGRGFFQLRLEARPARAFRGHWKVRRVCLEFAFGAQVCSEPLPQDSMSDNLELHLNNVGGDDLETIMLGFGPSPSSSSRSVSAPVASSSIRNKEKKKESVLPCAVDDSSSPFTISRKVKRKAEEGGKARGASTKLPKTNNFAAAVAAPASPPAALPASEIVDKASKAVVVAKYKSLSIAEDPMQFHAKPKDLSRNALQRPRGEEEGVGAAESGSWSAKVTSAKRKQEVGDGGGGNKTSLTFARAAFRTLQMHQKIIEQLEKPVENGGFGLNRSTCVQSAVIPLMAGSGRQNVLIKSQTGSGKTLAYLIPIINDFINMQSPVQRGEGTRALIIAPTRELSGQIADVLDRLTQCCVNVVGGIITGGEKKKSEKARLRKGVVILVGTPGRLLDHLKTTESFKLSLLRWIVMDEADRLLDMGFEQTILEILSIVRGERLPGLKAPTEKEREKAERSVKGNLQKRWSRQSAVQAKICDSTESIVHLMASATLTWGVKQLAMPVMGGSSFAVIDADRESISYVESPEDLLKLGGANRGNAESGRTVDFGNDDDDNVNDDAVNNGRIVVQGEDSSNSQGKGQVKEKANTSLAKGESIEAPQQLAQYYMMVTCKWRLAALTSFLRAHVHQKVVVFFATCDSVDFHSLLFREAEWPLDLDPGIDYNDLREAAAGENGEAGTKEAAAAASMNQVMEPLGSHFTGMFAKQFNMYRLHGSVPQQGRQAVFKEFCAAKTGVLFCTDVAARGLDLPRVDWILQYDPPCETADYVHRVGRTARRGLGGSALLFLLPSEAMYTQLLSSHSLQPEALSLQSLFIDTAQFVPGAAKFKNTDEMTAVILQRRLETVVQGNRPLLGAARQTFRSFVRAYATHSSDTKGIFSVQSLHLGHVAKTFGLVENPKALRNRDDMMAKIFNGSFTSANVAKGSHMTRKARDEKYSLSGGGSGGGGGGKKNFKDKQKPRKMGKSSSGVRNTSSGKFRQGGSYFKQKLKSAGEFAV